MVNCFLCENEIDQWVLFGNRISKEAKSNPVCFVCLKKLINTNGKDVGLKGRIENWLTEQKYSFIQIKDPSFFFHFVLREVGPFKIIINIFQKTEESDLIVGFMIFLNKKLSDMISKFSKGKTEEFKRKVDDFLSTIRVDSRLGYKVGYEIISENGNYGARYFVKIKASYCTKENFFKILKIVEDTSEKSGKFLKRELSGS